jgi:hypothetical protein
MTPSSGGILVATAVAVVVAVAIVVIAEEFDV